MNKKHFAQFDWAHETPRIEHDCEGCMLLGAMYKGADLYFCGNDSVGHFTLLARDGYNYSSGAIFAAHANDRLHEAAVRALDRGLLRLSVLQEESPGFRRDRLLTHDEAIAAQRAQDLERLEAKYGPF